MDNPSEPITDQSTSSPSDVEILRDTEDCDLMVVYDANDNTHNLKEHVCDTCGESFINQSLLIEHLNHCCSYCGKFFSEKDDLIIHLEYHMEEVDTDSGNRDDVSQIKRNSKPTSKKSCNEMRKVDNRSAVSSERKSGLIECADSRRIWSDGTSSAEALPEENFDEPPPEQMESFPRDASHGQIVRKFESKELVATTPTIHDSYDRVRSKEASLEHLVKQVTEESCAIDKVQRINTDANSDCELLNQRFFSETHNCSLCKTMVSDRGGVMAHMEKHASSRTQQCRICLVQLSRVSDLEDHYDLRSCLICDQPNLRPCEIYAHFILHSTRKPISCSLCLKAFSTTDEMHKHFEIQDCSLCSTWFLRACDRKRHMKTDHKSCERCEKCFKGSRSRDEHMRSYNCQFCGESVERKCGLVAHIMNHTVIMPIKCSVCFNWDSRKIMKGKLISRNQEMNEHVPNNSESKSKLVECKMCNALTAKSFDAVAHEKSHTVPTNCKSCKVQLRDSDGHLTNRLCLLCKPYKYFSRKCEIDAHMTIHANNTSLVCIVCAKEVVQMDELKSHVKTHSEIRTVRCEICGGWWSNKKHFTESNCSICRAKYSRDCEFKAHSKIHALLKCLICQKSFLKKAELRKHVNFHEKIQCKSCGEYFLREKDLDYHVKNYVCNDSLRRPSVNQMEILSEENKQMNISEAQMDTISEAAPTEQPNFNDVIRALIHDAVVGSNANAGSDEERIIPALPTDESSHPDPFYSNVENGEPHEYISSSNVNSNVAHDSSQISALGFESKCESKNESIDADISERDSIICNKAVIHHNQLSTVSDLREQNAMDSSHGLLDFEEGESCHVSSENTSETKDDINALPISTIKIEKNSDGGAKGNSNSHSLHSGSILQCEDIDRQQKHLAQERYFIDIEQGDYKKEPFDVKCEVDIGIEDDVYIKQDSTRNDYENHSSIDVSITDEKSRDEMEIENSCINETPAHFPMSNSCNLFSNAQISIAQNAPLVGDGCGEDQNLTSSENMSIYNQQLACKTCAKPFNTKYWSLTYMRIHEGQVEFLCERCRCFAGDF